MVWRSTEVADAVPDGVVPVDVVILTHDQRHLRRKLLHLAHGDMVMLDLKEPVHLSHGHVLKLDDGNVVEVVAAEEELYEIAARDPVRHAELCWHIGNRHLAAQIEADRILILRDHVIKAMIEGLGATVSEIREPFEPVHGAYHGHGGHGHGH